MDHFDKKTLDRMDLKPEPILGFGPAWASQGKEFLYVPGSPFLEKQFLSYLCRNRKG